MTRLSALWTNFLALFGVFEMDAEPLYVRVSPPERMRAPRRRR